MIILGIDPGTSLVGFAGLEVAEDRRRPRAAGERPLASRASNIVRVGAGRAGPCRVVDCGVLRLGRRAAVPARLAALREQFEALLVKLAPDELAIEEAFYGKSVQAALRVGEARGVILAAAHARGLSIHQFAPARIKRSVTGSGSASKDRVAEFAARQVGLSSIDGPLDVSDALATALCRYEEKRSSIGSLPRS